MQVHHQTAVFLAFYSERSRGAPLRYPLARAAWRTLAAAAARGDPAAIEAVWQAWLRHPDDERWELLAQCRGAQEMADAVIAAATDPARPAASRAAIGAFCTSHGLAPAGDAERAAFYLLVGQQAQHRAADPAGEALAAAYQAADEPVRAALRQAMTESGDLDLVRVVAAQRGPARPVTDAERRYLAGELARRRDWPALWRLAQGLTLAEAIAAVRLIDPGWRPADEPGRELLARLAGAGLDTTRQGKPALTTVRIETSKKYVRVGAFSPDGRRFAAMVYGPPAPSCHVCEFELPQGTMVAQHDYYPDRFPVGLLYIGGAIVVAGQRGFPAGGRVFLDRFTGSSPDVLAEFPASVGGLAPYADGFVVLRQSWVRRRELWAGRQEHYTRDGPSELLFCDPHGQMLRRISVWDGASLGRQVVVDPGSGRLAILGYEVVLYAPLGERMIARSWGSAGSLSCVCLLGPERLVAGGYETLQMWHLRDSRLVRQPMRRRVPRGHYVTSIVAVPQRGELAVLMSKGSPSPASVRYFDAQTLTEVEGQHGLAGKTGHALWSSPQGSAHALASGGSLDIAFTAHPLAPLVGRPMGDMTSSDLVAVAGPLGRHDQFPAERPALELLRACLEYRFGADVAVGDAPAPIPGTDDIALSAEP